MIPPRDQRDVRALVERLMPDRDATGSTLSSFIRGVTAGALIGAAIAGSALLQRERSKRAELEEVGAELLEDATPVRGEGSGDALGEAPGSSRSKAPG
jgi:hypothetical protein